ncbi:pectate disaccharide-lyase domain protein, partial [Vibrio parahaemolyticus V-223/04]
ERWRLPRDGNPADGEWQCRQAQASTCGRRQCSLCFGTSSQGKLLALPRY